jgi:hypothetical protein
MNILNAVPHGSALLFESLDRLSREELEESFDLLRSIVRSVIDVHTIADGQIYPNWRAANDYVRLYADSIERRIQTEVGTVYRRGRPTTDSSPKRRG